MNGKYISDGWAEGKEPRKESGRGGNSRAEAERRVQNASPLWAYPRSYAYSGFMLVSKGISILVCRDRWVHGSNEYILISGLLLTGVNCNMYPGKMGFPLRIHAFIIQRLREVGLTNWTSIPTYIPHFPPKNR